ncbi:hypothetical protein [Salisaeta longa]|uniref:hypothetical protein n=1 Tax=Salisaeta longa TaxID=503170 RepID=UPI0003B4A214|nr:hypothetical protein [Salisaeta longa]
MTLTLLLVHAAATLLMTGVIWVVQLVHYPAFRWIDPARTADFQAFHMRRITWIVGPAMTLELGTGLALLAYAPAAVPPAMPWSGAGLLVLIWGMTGLVHVPQHARLTDGFDAATHRALVRSNWIRTLAWTLRAALAGWMCAVAL